jgi:hypothetical protein
MVTDGVDLTRLDALETGIVVVDVVRRPAERRSDGTVLSEKRKLGSRASQVNGWDKGCVASHSRIKGERCGDQRKREQRHLQLSFRS